MGVRLIDPFSGHMIQLLALGELKLPPAKLFGSAHFPPFYGFSHQPASLCPQPLPLAMSWQTPGRKLTWADWPVPGNGVETNMNSTTDEGTNDILRVTKELETHGIPCCLVGISALIFYGAHRVRPVSSSWSVVITYNL